jgi:hypothetical protein
MSCLTRVVGHVVLILLIILYFVADILYVVPRETREGWPLLTVETEVNGDSKSANEKGLPWLVHWACREGTRDFCSAVAALVRQYKIIFPRRSLFQFLCPHRPASWDRLPCWVACLLVCVSGCTIIGMWCSG